MALLVGDFDFQHRDEAHIAIRLLAGVAKGRLVDALNLALGIARRPVEHIHAVPEVIWIDRAQLKIDKDGGVQLDIAQGEGEFLVFQPLRPAAPITADDARAGAVDLIRHAVVVVVEVKGIRRAVLVGIDLGVAAPGSTIGVDAAAVYLPRLVDGHFQAVNDPIPIAVGVQRVQVPGLIVVIHEAAHLGAIADPVAVRIPTIGQRVGAQIEDLGAVLQPVAVRIGLLYARAHTRFLEIGHAILVAVDAAVGV